MTALGDPVRIGPALARNRLVFPAHLTNAAVGRRPSAQHAAYYAARAAGGVGTIITEEQSVDPADRPYEKLVDGTDPGVVPGYRAITDAVHAHGALVLAQLGHNGGQSSSRYSRAPVDGVDDEPDPMFREVPRVLDDAGLARLVDGFATVAAHCAAGGFDGVEVQASQASIVRQLPLDRAGAFLDAVLAAVRDVLGPGAVVGVRLQGDEGLRGDGTVAGGRTTADAVALACRVAPRVDYLNTAVGVATRTLPLIEPPMGVPAGYAAHVPSAVRAAVDVPVIGVGRFTTPEQAAATLAAGACDLVGVVRGQIADPAFARKALGGERVRRCTGCNQECIARVGADQRLGCAVNPQAGRESLPVPASGPRHRVLVVGGGPAGLAAATTAAARGHDVHLVERAEHLGGQLALAATAPERGEWAHLVEDLTAALDGVRVSLGTAADPVLLAREAPDALIVATGSTPARPSWPGGDDPRVLDVAAVLSRARAGTAVPAGRVVVVDERGDHAAASVAELLARCGAAVTLLTPSIVAAERLGPTLDRQRWRRRAHDLGIALRTERVVLALAPDGGPLEVLHHTTGHREPVAVDAVVTALPRSAHAPLLGGPTVRVGDALAPRGVAEAVREGTAAAEAL